MMRFSGGAAFIHGVFGVVEEVDEDLENFVFVHQDGRGVVVFADDFDGMAAHGALVHFQGVIHQIGQLDGFDRRRRCGRSFAGRRRFP